MGFRARGFRQGIASFGLCGSCTCVFLKGGPRQQQQVDFPAVLLGSMVYIVKEGVPRASNYSNKLNRK